MERAEVPFFLAGQRCAFSGHSGPTPHPLGLPSLGHHPRWCCGPSGLLASGPLLSLPRPGWLLLECRPPPLGGFPLCPPPPGPLTWAVPVRRGSVLVCVCPACRSDSGSLVSVCCTDTLRSQSEISLGLGVRPPAPSLTPAPLPPLQGDWHLCLSPF